MYNYYYVILRNKPNGDTTSRVFETETPKALDGETQRNVNMLFGLYTLFYSVFDKIIYQLDGNAVEAQNLPNWFVTVVSTFGLGFQLLLIGNMMVFDFKHYIIPFFTGYFFFILVFIAIRRLINR